MDFLKLAGMLREHDRQVNDTEATGDGFQILTVW
jgi:hypothetical protein